MILVDTNVIIDLWKNPERGTEEKEIFERERICICGW